MSITLLVNIFGVPKIRAIESQYLAHEYNTLQDFIENTDFSEIEEIKLTGFAEDYLNRYKTILNEQFPNIKIIIDKD